MKKKLVLLIFDGFGIGPDNEFNAFERSDSTYIKNFLKNNPCSLLKTHGSAVGLPEDQMGNSEVGHITIGAGRVIFGDLTRINNSISDGDFENKLLRSVDQNSKRIHICGLLSKGGVHSHEDHFFKTIEIFLKQNIKVFAHIFLDGRDCGTNESLKSIEKLLEKFGNNSNFTLASAVGRAFGMDRDNRFEKTKIAFDLISSGANFHVFNSYETLEKAESSPDFLEIIQKFHSMGLSDEYIPPIVLNTYLGAQKDDSIFFVNWRADRMRQIVSSLTSPDFHEFERKAHPNLYFQNSFSMGWYSSEISKFCKPIFPKEDLDETLGDILEKEGLSQLRIAETEKYAHVTFFFDGGKNKTHKNKMEILIDSPKDVQTYDQKPEMSGPEVKEKIIENLENFDVIIANFANLDMIGHTGNFDACIKTFDFLDYALKEIDEAIQEKALKRKEDWFLILTSDHGNAEEMFDFEKNEIKTCHSKNPVPFVLKSYNNQSPALLKENGDLSDISPTILDLLLIPKSKNFSGQSLIKK